MNISQLEEFLKTHRTPVHPRTPPLEVEDHGVRYVRTTAKNMQIPACTERVFYKDHLIWQRIETGLLFDEKEVIAVSEALRELKIDPEHPYKSLTPELRGMELKQDHMGPITLFKGTRILRKNDKLLYTADYQGQMF